MDIIGETRPLMLQIFMSQPNGKLTLAVSSTKIIEPQYPVENHGKHGEFQISSIIQFDTRPVVILQLKIRKGKSLVIRLEI